VKIYGDLGYVTQSRFNGVIGIKKKLVFHAL